MTKQQKVCFLLFLITGCAKKIGGAGSASIISPPIEAIHVLPSIEPTEAPEALENKKLGIGIGHPIYAHT